MIRLKPAHLAFLGAAVLAAQTAPGLDPAFFLREPRDIMLDCADKARAARFDDSRALAEFGRIYLAAGARDRALEAFQRAERIGKRDATTHSLVARAWLQNGAKAEALAAAKRAVELAPRNKALIAELGVRFTDAGFLPEGGAYMEQAYQLEPGDREQAIEFGRACLRARQPDPAAVWFRRALTGSSEDNQVYRIVGLAYADLGAR